MTSRHQHRRASHLPNTSHAPTATTSVAIEELFHSSGLDPDWRTIAVKQALKELAGTLSSVLCELTICDDRGCVLCVSPTEARLLELLPELLAEAVRLSHVEILTTAIRQIAAGHSIDLVPLCQSALSDLAAVARLQRSAPAPEGDLL